MAGENAVGTYVFCLDQLSLPRHLPLWYALRTPKVAERLLFHQAVVLWVRAVEIEGFRKGDSRVVDDARIAQ